MPDYPRPHRKHVVYNLSQADSYHGMPVDLAVTEFFQSVPELPEITPWDWVTESDDIRDAVIAIVRGYIQRNNIPEMTPAKTPMFSDPVILASPPFYWGRTQLLSAESAAVLQVELVHELQQILIDRFPLWRIRWESGRAADDVLIYPDAIYVGEWDDLPLAEALDQWRRTVAERERQEQSPEVLKLRWLRRRVSEALPELSNRQFLVLGAIRGLDEWEGEELLSVWLLYRGEKYDFTLDVDPVAGSATDLQGTFFPVARYGEIGMEGDAWTAGQGVAESLISPEAVENLVVHRREQREEFSVMAIAAEWPVHSGSVRIYDAHTLD